MKTIQDIFKDLQGSNKEIQTNIKNIKITKPILLIAMTARTGSTAFCSLLANDERIGACKELFNPRAPIHRLIDELGKTEMSFVEYIEHIEQYRSQDYFCFKVTWQDFNFFVKNKIDNSLFGKSQFIFLDRLDIEEQVVSLDYSIKTNFWHSNQKHYVDKEGDISFNKADLDAITAQLLTEKENWWNYFYSNEVTPLVFHYENFTINFAPAYSEILNSLGLSKKSIINWQHTSIYKFHSQAKTKLVTALRKSRYGEDSCPP